MDRKDFDTHFEKLIERFTHRMRSVELEQYWDRVKDWSSPTWAAVIERALKDCTRFPEIAALVALMQDLTYWDPGRFVTDWDNAYWNCTNDLYWESHQDEMAQCLGRRNQIQKFARDRGGVTAVRRLLKDYATRGYLQHMTCLDFLDGKIPDLEETPREALGYRR